MPRPSPIPPSIDLEHFPWGQPAAVLRGGFPLVVIRDEDVDVFTHPYSEVEGRWPGQILTRRDADGVLRRHYADHIATALLVEIDVALGLGTAHERAALEARRQETSQGQGQ